MCVVTLLIVLYPVCVCVLSVERYVGDLHKHEEAAGEGVYAVPTGAHVKDNEQVCVGFLGGFTSSVSLHSPSSYYSTSSTSIPAQQCTAAWV